MPCVYLPGPAPAVTVANSNEVSKFFWTNSTWDQKTQKSDTFFKLLQKLPKNNKKSFAKFFIKQLSIDYYVQLFQRIYNQQKILHF